MTVVLLGVFGCSQPGTETAEEAANLAAARAADEAYNAGDLGFIDRFYAEDLVYVSYGPWAPGGSVGDRESLKQGVAFGLKAFPDRRSTLLSRVVRGDTIVDEMDWVGTASAEHPAMKEGERMVLKDITFSRYRDGKVVELREYAILVPEEPEAAGGD